MMDETRQKPDELNGDSGNTKNAPCRGLPAKLERPAEGKLSNAVAPVRVLIVEDSPIIRKRLAMLVACLPNVVVVGTAEDGFQAQALFRRHRPDAVILDIQLPGIDGMDLLPQFKAEHPACVVVVLTSYAFEGFRQRCSALGSDHFFDKSTEFERAIEVLGTVEPRGGSKIGH